LTFNGLYSIILQKIDFFITTVVRTSNPTQFPLSSVMSSVISHQHMTVGVDLSPSVSAV
jgi:hypothetical protein